MATKLNDRKNGGRNTSDSKRVTFDRGVPKLTGGGLPLKTSTVERK